MLKKLFRKITEMKVEDFKLLKLIYEDCFNDPEVQILDTVRQQFYPTLNPARKNSNEGKCSHPQRTQNNFWESKYDRASECRKMAK